jgi:hypothetical protein
MKDYMKIPDIEVIKKKMAQQQEREERQMQKMQEKLIKTMSEKLDRIEANLRSKK